jgi:hypothetical protein
MGKFGLLDNYSADPSLGKMGGLKEVAGAGPGVAAGAGGMDMGSMIASLLPMLMGGMGQGSTDKDNPKQSIIGGGGGSPVQAQLPQFTKPPSTGQLIAEMLAKQKGGY